MTFSITAMCTRLGTEAGVKHNFSQCSDGGFTLERWTCKHSYFLLQLLERVSNAALQIEKNKQTTKRLYVTLPPQPLLLSVLEPHKLVLTLTAKKSKLHALNCPLSINWYYPRQMVSCKSTLNPGLHDGKSGFRRFWVVFSFVSFCCCCCFCCFWLGRGLTVSFSKDLYCYLPKTKCLNLILHFNSPPLILKLKITFYYQAPEWDEKYMPLASCSPREDVRKTEFRCRCRKTLTKPHHIQDH